MMTSSSLKLQRLIIISVIFSTMGCIKNVSSSTLGQCTTNSKLNKKNRDGKLPIFPLKEDTLVKSSFIYKAHEIIANGLKQWLDLDEAELGIYLNHVVSQSNNITYFDKYGQMNTALDRQLFHSIWVQFNETLCENYAVKQFKKDQLDLCQIAELLSHQPTVTQKETILKKIGAALRYKKCDQNDLEDWERRNRDGQLPTLPPIIDLRRQSGAIVQAHEILRKSLQQFLDFQDRGLGTYLSYIINQLTEPFVDEYGKLITSYERVFRSILEQYNETQVQNYAIRQFENDKLDVCSVARFLSHQSAVENRVDLVKRVGDALGDRCHPCTPYKRKELGGMQVVLGTDNITIPDVATPDESFEICKSFEEKDIEITTFSSPLTERPPQRRMFQVVPSEENVSNTCCLPPNPVKFFGLVISGDSCPGGEPSTPCCGRRSCNAFCCACAGDCWS